MTEPVTGSGLSGRAVEILEEAKTNAPRSELVFPSPRGVQLRALALSDLLRTLGIAAVPHGFRSSFRDWAAECTDGPRAVMEAALAHMVPQPGRGGLRPARTCSSAAAC